MKSCDTCCRAVCGTCVPNRELVLMPLQSIVHIMDVIVDKARACKSIVISQVTCQLRPSYPRTEPVISPPSLHQPSPDALELFAGRSSARDILRYSSNSSSSSGSRCVCVSVGITPTVPMLHKVQQLPHCLCASHRYTFALNVPSCLAIDVTVRPEVTAFLAA